MDKTQNFHFPSVKVSNFKMKTKDGGGFLFYILKGVYTISLFIYQSHTQQLLEEEPPKKHF